MVSARRNGADLASASFRAAFIPSFKELGISGLRYEQGLEEFLWVVGNTSE